MMWILPVRNTIFEKPNVPQRGRAGRDSRENILTCGKNLEHHEVKMTNPQRSSIKILYGIFNVENNPKKGRLRIVFCIENPV